MKTIWLIGLLMAVVISSLSAQSLIYPVNDADAIEQSTQHLIFNVLKQQQYKNILEEKQEIERHYSALFHLQQQVIQQLRQVRSVEDLQWADLSKATYLAEELIRGRRTPGLEIDFWMEHPVLDQSPAQTYRDLFLVDSSDPLPATLQAMREAQSSREEIIYSFAQVAAHRKAYAAVAFQYLSSDLVQKATEMNAVLKQPQRFSMTEAERLQLQADAEGLLKQAAQMLERSDRLLIEVGKTPAVQRKSLQQQILIERQELGRTQLFGY